MSAFLSSDVIWGADRGYRSRLHTCPISTQFGRRRAVALTTPMRVSLSCCIPKGPCRRGLQVPVPFKWAAQPQIANGRSKTFALYSYVGATSLHRRLACYTIEEFLLQTKFDVSVCIVYMEKYRNLFCHESDLYRLFIYPPHPHSEIDKHEQT